MSNFTSPLVLEVLPNRKFKLTEEFTYYTDIPYLSQGTEDKIFITVPVGFKTDLATIPRILWSIFPPHGEYGKAAVLHDYMYVSGMHNKKWADKVFYEAMKVLGVPRWKRQIMYYTVKIIGKGNY